MHLRLLLQERIHLINSLIHTEHLYSVSSKLLKGAPNSCTAKMSSLN